MDRPTGLTEPEDARIEDWFVRQGLPHFIGDYRASTDVFNRAVPFLVLMFLFQVSGAMDVDRTGWREFWAVIGGVLIIGTAAILVNRVRGRRPFQLPDRFGLLEMAVFVLVPPFVPLLLGGTEMAGALGVLVFQIVVLVLTWVVVGFGLLWMTRWAVMHAIGQLGDIANLMIRSLPLLLLFTTFLFLNAELWQVASDFTQLTFWVTVGLLVGAAAAFLALRLPREMEGLAKFADWRSVDHCLPTALDGLAGGNGETADLDYDPADGAVAPALDRVERFNVMLVLVFSQAVQILLVATVIGGFYVLFGLFAVREETIIQWTELSGSVDIDGTKHLPDDQVLVRFLDRQLALSWPLLRTCGFLAAFSALQFTVSALTDQTYREEFLEDVVDDVRSALAVRARYLQRGSY